MKTCVEEGILQAYLDGELPPDSLRSIASHLAACRSCAALAQDAEAEMALFSTALAPTLSPASVPTARLRERLDKAIAGMRQPPAAVNSHGASRLREWFAGLSSLLTYSPARATAFASLLVAVLLSALAMTQFPSREINGGEIVSVSFPPIDSDLPLAPPPVQAAAVVVEPAPKIEKNSVDAPVKDTLGKPVRHNVAVKRSNQLAAEKAKAPALLPGEKTYLSAIASLTSTIESRGPQSISPTLRVEYERNLALVDQAIISTRVAARRDPQDTDAQDFLRSAYQNKVELLSAVAGQAELAAIKD